MAHLPFFSYDGYGKDVEPVFHYSQAVKRGDIIEISGQGAFGLLLPFGCPSSGFPLRPRQMHAPVQQAVRPRLTGTGGWDPKTHAVDPDINKQIDQAFENVQLALVTAGGQGWVEVS